MTISRFASLQNSERTSSKAFLPKINIWIGKEVYSFDKEDPTQHSPNFTASSKLLDLGSPNQIAPLETSMNFLLLDKSLEEDIAQKYWATVVFPENGISKERGKVSLLTMPPSASLLLIELSHIYELFGLALSHLSNSNQTVEGSHTIFFPCRLLLDTCLAKNSIDITIEDGL